MRAIGGFSRTVRLSTPEDGKVDIYAGGIIGLLILIADIWAILNIAQAKVGTTNKLLWIVLILVLPLIGLVIWWLAGPREGQA